MKLAAFTLLALCMAACSRSTREGATAQAVARPNIVFILADDLGYSDIGAFGSEIPTPNLDALARQGMVLTGFYAGMSCAPTRAMLMSGMDNHLAGNGRAWARPARPARKPGYEGHLIPRRREAQL